ncbi:transporter protein hol1 [Fusarium bulbicola]|nr:transporter protein hol1 [Fusarium bulbicola]
MAEALGTASALITIWDLVSKAKGMHDHIKTAPGAWKRYCDGLESLGHVQNVLEEMVQSTPRMAIPMIQVREGKRQNLASFVNENLETVRKQAVNILDRHNLETHRSSAKRILERLKLCRESYLFVLDEREIKSLGEAVESAKLTLHLALQLLYTNTLFSGGQRMEEELRNIHDSMRKQTDALEAIEKNKKLSQIPLEVNLRKGSASLLKKATRGSILRLGRPKKKSNHAFKALVGSKTVTVSQLVESEAQLSPGNASQAITLEEQDELAEMKEVTHDLDVSEARVNACDKTGDKLENRQDENHSSLSKSLIMVRQEKPQNRQYDLVWRDGEIFSIGTDTDMYKAAFEAQIGDYQSIPMFRLDYLLENLADAQQGQDAIAQDDPEELLALEMPSLEESDMEPAAEGFSVPIDCQRPTYAFIGKGVDLEKYILDATTSLPFCVWVVCDLQPCQMFALQEPCDSVCKHARLEVMDIFTLQRALHYTMTFRSMSYGMLLNDGAAISTQADLNLESFNKCKNECRHTWIESVSSPEVCCVRPVNLRAWLSDDIAEGETVASEEDGASYEDSISVDSIIDDDRGDDDDDDQRAVDLWQEVIKGGSDIPARIDLGLLVSYLKVVDKCDFGELYSSQGLDWADALLPNISTSFDEDAIAWLWILWRLHMATEFKELSAIVAQQATCPLVPEHDRHGVEMPQCIINAIEQKRIDAIGQVSECVYRVYLFCKEYKDSMEQSWPSWGRKSQTTSSTSSVTYLLLETEKHLPGVQEAGNPYFLDISFEDTAKWIRSMMNPENWIVRTLPPVTAVTQLLAYLSFSNIGVLQCEVEDSTVLSSHVQKEFTSLITRLEAEDWGIELDTLT